MTTYVLNVANQTKADFFNHLNPKNLTQFLTWQDGKNVIVNSVLGGVAFLPGYYAAANVTKVFHNWTHSLQGFETTYWVISIFSKAIGACVGAAVNFWLVRTIVPLPASFAAEKAMALFSLVALGTYFVRGVITTLPFKVNVPITTSVVVFGAMSGCYPSSALYVAGVVGALEGAMVKHIANDGAGVDPNVGKGVFGRK